MSGCGRPRSLCIVIVVIINDSVAGTVDGLPSDRSDGIFVFAPGAADVAEGDLVQVTGTAGENFGMTQLSNATLLDCGEGTMPAATELELPIDDHERFESMLVTLPQELAILEYFNFGRFGQVVVGTERQLHLARIDFRPDRPLVSLGDPQPVTSTGKREG